VGQEQDHTVPRAPEGREKTTVVRSSTPPGLGGDSWGFGFPGLTPWATVSRPSGAKRLKRCDMGELVISDKVCCFRLLEVSDNIALLHLYRKIQENFEELGI